MNYEKGRMDMSMRPRGGDKAQSAHAYFAMMAFSIQSAFS